MRWGRGTVGMRRGWAERCGARGWGVGARRGPFRCPPIPGLTERVVHVHVVSVPPVALHQGVGHPAALRVALLALAAGQRVGQQLRLPARCAAVLGEGALVELQALGAGAAGSRGVSAGGVGRSGRPEPGVCAGPSGEGGPPAPPPRSRGRAVVLPTPQAGASPAGRRTLTQSRRRVRGSRGTLSTWAAGSRGRTGTRCSGTGRGRCTRRRSG